MPRQPILALGLVALALALGPASARAVRPPTSRTTPAAEGRVAAPAATAPGRGRTRSRTARPASPNILEPQPSLAIWTVVVFLGLLFVLGKFAWKPLLAALHQREEHLEHVLHETERARNESEQLLAEHRRQIAAGGRPGPGPDRARPGRTPRPPPTRSSSKAQAEAEADAAAGRARHRDGPRPGPRRRSGRRRPTWPSRSPARSCQASSTTDDHRRLVDVGDRRAAGRRRPTGTGGRRMTDAADARPPTSPGRSSTTSRPSCAHLRRGPARTPPRRRARSTPCSTSSTRSSPTCSGAVPDVRRDAGLAARRRRREGPHPRRDVRGPGPADGRPVPPRAQPPRPARAAGADRRARPGRPGTAGRTAGRSRSARPSRSTTASRPRSATASAAMLGAHARSCTSRGRPRADRRAWSSRSATTSTTPRSATASNSSASA